MRLMSECFAEGGPLPERFAFSVLEPSGCTVPGPNRSPPLAWIGLPAGARSMVVTCHDPDALSRSSEAVREDRETPPDSPRLDFFHWLLIDLPPGIGGLAEGASADGVVAGGKRQAQGPSGSRYGLNDYTGALAADETMRGWYYGYDGPCPPRNDAIPHRYTFTAYALATARAPVEGAFQGRELLAAIRPHVLAAGQRTALYSLNPRVPAGSAYCPP